jgi:hypothetical protein
MIYACKVREQLLKHVHVVNLSGQRTLVRTDRKMYENRRSAHSKIAVVRFPAG